MPTAELTAAAERVTAAGVDKAPATPAASDTERARKYRERVKQEGKRPRGRPPKGMTETPAPMTFEITADDVQEGQFLGTVLWDLSAVQFFHLKPLDETQKARLGEALAPLIKKYLPLLGNWQYEVAAALVIVSLVRENAVAVEIIPKASVATARSLHDEGRPAPTKDDVKAR